MDNKPSCPVCGKVQGYSVGEAVGECSLKCVVSHIKTDEEKDETNE